MRSVYLSHNPYPAFAHETTQYIEYIDIIKNENRTPDKFECWICYHPPLYMWVAAYFSKIADRVYPSDTRTHVQFFSFLLSIFFMALSAIYLHIVLKPQAKGEMGIFYGIFAFAVLWSAVILNTVRIGNESLNYIWFLSFLISLQKWIETKNKKFLIAIVTSVLLVYFTKSSWVIPLGIFVSYFLLRFLKLRWLVLAGCAVIALEAGLQNHGKSLVGRTVADHLVPNMAGLPDDLRVKNSIQTLFGFHLPFYFENSISNPLKALGDRDYFWSFFLRTSRVGEFEYRNLRFIHNLQSLLFLILIVAFIYVTARLKVKWPAVPALDLTMSLFALMSMRLAVPYACAQDMRYIQVCFVSFAALLGYALMKSQKAKWLSGVIAILIVCSIVIIVSLKP